MLATVLALLLVQEKNEAEELFKKMEEKIAAAKSIHVTLKGVMAQEAQEIGLSVELHLGEKNQASGEFTMKNGPREISGRCVSDGRNVGTRAIDGKLTPPFEAPETLGRQLRVRLARAGVAATIEALQIERIAKQDPETAIGASDFKLGEKEKIRDREAQRVDYTMTKAGEPERKATIWIDLATHLPLKRVLKMRSMTLTEEYTVLVTDAKIDPAKFELPKEAK
jgi:outer membrane lipoprotein-sorting protein